MNATQKPILIDVSLKPWGKWQRYCATVQLPDGTTEERWLKRVTTILGVLDKPALIQWAANEACEFIAEAWEPNAAYSKEHRDEILRQARYAHKRKKEEAANLGTMAHEYIEDFLTSGSWPTDSVWDFLPEEVQNSLTLFRDWWDQQDLKVVATEKYLANLDLNYGGTLDFLCENSAGELVVWDWKTSKGIYGEMKLQLAAYVGALALNGYTVAQAGILRIGKTDAAFETLQVPLPELRDLYRVFAALVPIYEWRSREEREAKKRRGIG